MTSRPQRRATLLSRLRAVQSLVDFWDQLNYVHLQDYASCTVRDPGQYNPKWVSVGEAECLDFAAVLKTLEDRNFTRWVTACPGEPAYEGEDAVSEAERSAGGAAAWPP